MVNSPTNNSIKSELYPRAVGDGGRDVDFTHSNPLSTEPSTVEENLLLPSVFSSVEENRFFHQ